MIYKLALLIHLTALILLAGSTLFSFLNFRKILKSAYQRESFIINIGIANLGFGLGLALFIISGVTFIALAGGYTSQIWFKIKMAAVLIIIANNLVFGRPAMKQAVKNPDTIIGAITLQRLHTYYYVQFFMLACILVLSSFKFN
jgi:hypothetical protein